MGISLEILFVIALTLINGVFAMSELAVVSSRKGRLMAMERERVPGAAAALALHENPGRFLPTVQVGITLVGILAGVFGGAALARPLGEALEELPFVFGYGQALGFGVVVLAITYANLILGELVPKQLALRNAVPLALIMARPMAFLSRAAAPLVWLLDSSSAAIIRLFGIRRTDEASVTAEELQMIFAEATRSGVIEDEQRQILTGVVRLAERPVREMMTPRTEVDWIEADAELAEIRQTIEESPHSLLPVAEGSPDTILGVVKVREVLGALVAGNAVSIRAMMRRVEVVPDQLDAMDALRVLQSAEVAMAAVTDEYGHFEGIVTPVDLLTAIVGNFASDSDDGDLPTMVEREDGSLLVSGSLSADALADRLGLEYGENREFGTAAGYVLSVLKKLPGEGEHFTDQGWRFEVVDMDGRRIDKLLVSKVRGEGGD
jgi:putative hemolysin